MYSIPSASAIIKHSVLHKVLVSHPLLEMFITYRIVKSIDLCEHTSCLFPKSHRKERECVHSIKKGTCHTNAHQSEISIFTPHRGENPPKTSKSCLQGGAGRGRAGWGKQ